MIRFLVLVLAVAAFATVPTPSVAQPAKAKKIAVLIGVKKYGEETGLRDLEYTERDVTDLAAVLEKQGYTITLLTRAEAAKLDKDFHRPTAKNIRQWLDRATKDCQAEDTVLVAFSGHGAHLKKTDKLYFCPSDTDLTDEKSLVCIDEVAAKLKDCQAGTKILFFDACRNDPADGRTAGSGELKSTTRPLIPDLPGGTVALFSCSKGEISHESKTFGRGFLFHHLIEGLSEKAADKKGEVTWLGLAKFVADELPEAVKKEKGPKVVQTPEVKGEARALVLAKVVVGASAYELGKEDMKKALDLYYGRGVGADVAKATPFFLNAAKAGNPDAMWYMGTAYKHAFGVKRDSEIALEWFKKAARAGQPHAMQKRWPGEPWLSYEEIDKASAEIRRRAKGGDPVAMYAVSKDSFLDSKESANWLRKAAEAGEPFAMEELASLTFSGLGLGVKPNREEGIRWWRRAAEAGYPQAMFELAEIHSLAAAYDLPQNDEAAMYWYKKAAETGHRMAMNGVASAYRFGKGIKQDKSEAIRWLKIAAEAGGTGSMYDLGVIHESGEGVRADRAEAIRWYRQGAKLKNKECLEALKRLGVDVDP